MNKILLVFLAFVGLASLDCAVAVEQDYKLGSCSYWNDGDNSAYSYYPDTSNPQGNCTESDGDDGQYFVLVKLGNTGKVVKVRWSDQRQGAWSYGQIDGRAAIIFEINRCSHSATTMDLKTALDWERGPTCK